MSRSYESAFRLLRRALAGAGEFEKTTLAALAIVVLATWGFVELADSVTSGETRALDRTILLAFRNAADSSDPIGPRWFEEVMRDITALGGTTVLTMITLGVAGYLALDGKRHAAVVVLVSIGTGLLLSHGLKLGFARPRPDLVPHGATVYTASFPSGHATMAAVVYLTLGVLLARTRAKRTIRVYILTTAMLLTALVGVSRVYLGVHWPTDVIAGWAAGTAWALLCWLVMLWLQERGKVEEPDDGEADADRDGQLHASRDKG
jgi:undecaprenyl-diphosphatase